VIQVRPDLLEEEDGPTLRHAIQGLHGQEIRLPHRPNHRPNVQLLTRRYERFVELAGV
jgi:putative restriction endonuclease